MINKCKVRSISKQHQAQKPSLTSFHFVRLAPLAGLHYFPFHFVCSVFRAFSARLKVATKASAFLSLKSLLKPLLGRHQQHSETAKGTKLFAHSIPFHPQPDAPLHSAPVRYFTFHSVYSSFRAFSATCKGRAGARASFLSTCHTGHHTAPTYQSSHAHPPESILSRNNIQTFPKEDLRGYRNK
jgi:hypothetical protein